MIGFGKHERDDRAGELSADLIVPIYQVWPNYFETIRLPIRAGRPFRNDESRDSVIVSESFADHFWPGGGAVGRHVRWEGENWLTIVGVAGEVRQLSLDDSTGSFEFYMPLRRPPGLPAQAGMSVRTPAGSFRTRTV
ncbi:MAG TPA: ABC transporter permease [Vicinamibacterales bacterium]|nr:ABC transporter permease [Vicinamibacterales bacterium]